MITLGAACLFLALLTAAIGILLALVGQRDSLITKCPSKFTTQAQQDPQHVVITGN